MVERVLKTGVGQWMQGSGCNQCNHTGFLGRIGVYELLRVNDEIRNLVTERANHAAIHDAAARDGMRTMQAEGFALVNAGITTFDEVQRTVYAPLDEMVFDEAAESDLSKIEANAAQRNQANGTNKVGAAL